MRKILFAALVLLLLGALFPQVSNNYPGFLVIGFGGELNKGYEMNLWFAFVALLTILFTLFLAVWLILSLIRAIRGSVDRLRFGRQRVARRRLTNGLVEFMEGNWSRARRQLLKSAPRSEAPLINYLAAARSAFELGFREEANELLAKAEACGEETLLAVALNQARMQLQDKHYEQCIASLKRAKQLQPKHPALLQLLRQAYYLLGDWSSLRELLPELEKHAGMSDDELQQLELQIYQHQLDEAANRNDRDRLQRIWHSLNGRWQRNMSLRSRYATLLHQVGEDTEAEKHLRWLLNREWSAELGDLYGRLTGVNPAAQLSSAEGWLKEYGESADLLTCLGRLSLRNELWGRAQQYFEKSLLLRQDPVTSAELARLLQALGEKDKAAQLYEEGLMQAINDLPQLPMPSRDTPLLGAHA
ncbi:heme biosynthesis HemY N-terminal domain-containing protein [Microbulbifer sp. 2205BS26-8]|uniref:heme biosynthesis HemY N-terminal domain-containing protein n=1 Tax=Microbulbifer sp. 2205BS26-8 TaxID=3064386 RepID=UPI00273E3201|nr:heme biosynthesis HemY N-terminal domain-containing protein [Microbulbifer sp. 2205BS26-8]MDP5208131.1 heme biosynthesis HemY N-terminal domain-containing protein [Microbulbifer sp. 2205BS26-8]